MVERAVVNEAVKPSLLRQIVDAVDTMDDDGKKEVLRKIKMLEALRLAKLSDEMVAGNPNLTEDEIAEMVSEDRRSRYNRM